MFLCCEAFQASVWLKSRGDPPPPSSSLLRVGAPRNIFVFPAGPAACRHAAAGGGGFFWVNMMALAVLLVLVTFGVRALCATPEPATAEQVTDRLT